MLAGGRGSRLGGIEKGELRVNGERLIDIAVEAARATGCERVIIAGDITARGAISRREDPPYGGPVAGLAAALPEATDEWILLLGCDLPHARPLSRLLVDSLDDADDDLDGVVAVADGRIQWLAGIYRRTSLEAALLETGNPAGTSMKALLGSLELGPVPDERGWTRDVDNPQDLEAFTRGKENHE